MENGKKQINSEPLENFTRVNIGSDMGIHVDKSRPIFSNKYRDLGKDDFDLYSFDSIYIFLGYGNREQDRIGFVQAEFSKKVSYIFNIFYNNISGLNNSWIIYPRRFNKFNTNSNGWGGCRSIIPTCIYSGNRRGINLQRVGGGKIKRGKNISKLYNVDFINSICFISCRNGQINIYNVALYSPRNIILYYKKEVLSTDKYGKCRNTLCMEYICPGIFGIND